MIVHASRKVRRASLCSTSMTVTRHESWPQQISSTLALTVVSGKVLRDLLRKALERINNSQMWTYWYHDFDSGIKSLSNSQVSLYARWAWFVNSTGDPIGTRLQAQLVFLNQIMKDQLALVPCPRDCASCLSVI
jgi:hypothetical protein